MKSKPYRFQKKLFRYDFEDCVVEYIAKADSETIADDEEWKKTHNGRSLYDIDQDGYMVLATAGLRKENWTRKAVRDEYLEEWCGELDFESSVLVQNFLRWELPEIVEREAS